MTTLYYQMGVRKTGSINRDSGIEIPEASRTSSFDAHDQKTQQQESRATNIEHGLIVTHYPHLLLTEPV